MVSPTANYDANTRSVHCSGNWTLAHYTELSKSLENIAWPKNDTVTFEGSDINAMDSAGAWLINQWLRQLKEKGLTVKLQGFPEQYQKLLNLIESEASEGTDIPQPEKLGRIATIGKMAVNQYREGIAYLNFMGFLSLELLRIIPNPRRWRINAITAAIYNNGFLALPIIALLSFMVGVVLTYQMGLQLKNYGANIFIVDLLGLAILREFGPLLTSIMVAGRTGSAYTAQLGTMKINQEVDALNTMGVTPAELLILPRISGLVIALPLLSIWADIWGVLGGMVMSNNLLNITWYDFLHRFPRVIPLKTLLLGLVKTPVFAIIIASVGCFQGMQVSGSADSVGRNTTKSVVISIFFIILADALFSIYFSKLKL